MALVLALDKKLEEGKQALKLSLAKKGINNPPNAELAFLLDVSGSFDDEHKDGLTQTLLERLVPWGMLFDPDQNLDVFTFSDGQNHAHHVGGITPATTEHYIARNIINRVPGYGSGTDYGYVLEKALRHFGWISSPGAPAKKPGLFGSLFGRKGAASATPVVQKKRSIVLFVTDGENSDKPLTERVLAESEKRGDEVYFLFIAISNQGGSFPFLQQIGDRFNNTGLVIIRDLKGFNQKPDDEINDLLIGDELVNWLKR
jgi:hypothetical protein